MGNLGGYETIITVVKQLGGPTKAIAKTLVATVTVSVAGTLGIQKLIDRTKRGRRSEPDTAGKAIWIEVTADVANDEGLTVNAGEWFRVISRDGNVVVIEVKGRADNPHVVSAEYLSSNSDFSAEDTD